MRAECLRGPDETAVQVRVESSLGVLSERCSRRTKHTGKVNVQEGGYKPTEKQERSSLEVVGSLCTSAV